MATLRAAVFTLSVNNRWGHIMPPPSSARVNPRPAGPLDFPPPAGGGGRLNAPPP